MYFANTKFLKSEVLKRVSKRPELQHVVLQFSAINSLDVSAISSLEGLNEELNFMNIKLHLSRVKGPVMDRLERANLMGDLTVKIFLSPHDAFLRAGK